MSGLGALSHEDKVLLWVLANSAKLQAWGLLERLPGLTDEGRVLADELDAAGFVPHPSDLIEAVAFLKELSEAKITARGHAVAAAIMGPRGDPKEN